MSVNNQNLRVNANQQLKNRVKAIKADLPKGYREIIIEQYPEYDTIRGGNLIKNVVQGRTADKRLTEILEKIVTGVTSVEHV